MTTGKMTSIARPYAIAAFEFASSEKTVPAWEAMLETAGLLSQDESVQQLLLNPRMTTQQMVDFYCDILTTKNLLDQEMKNLICLLAEYHRLTALSDIAALFKSYRAEQEKTVTVKVTSAVKLNPDFQHKLIQTLTKRLQRQVSLECSLDENLLGGAVITAGDTVIDGSVRGKLNRMVEFISGISLR